MAIMSYVALIMTCTMQVIVKVEDCPGPVVVRPPTPVDSVADTMYFLTM